MERGDGTGHELPAAVEPCMERDSGRKPRQPHCDHRHGGDIGSAFAGQERRQTDGGGQHGLESGPSVAAGDGPVYGGDRKRGRLSAADHAGRGHLSADHPIPVRHAVSHSGARGTADFYRRGRPDGKTHHIADAGRRSDLRLSVGRRGSPF